MCDSDGIKERFLVYLFLSLLDLPSDRFCWKSIDELKNYHTQGYTVRKSKKHDVYKGIKKQLARS